MYIHINTYVYKILDHVGKEFGCGIFVSTVLPSSKAAQNGLKVSTGSGLLKAQ